jgi:hypothetical protein
MLARSSLSQGTCRVVPDMRRPARAERRCRRCPFCGPSGQCLDRAIKSGHCGDWIWFVRYGKQIRRPYICPHDPRTPAQLRSRARLSAASRKHSYSITERQRAACIKSGAKRRNRPRLHQSGPLTGQQYSIGKEYALQNAHGKGIKAAFAPQVLKPQRVNPTSWDPRRGSGGTTGVSACGPAEEGIRPERAEVKNRLSCRFCNILTFLAGHTSSGQLFGLGDFSQRAHGGRFRRCAPGLGE